MPQPLNTSFLPVYPGVISGLQITTSGPTTIERASGQSAKLDCHFTLAPEDTGPLDIEWSVLPSDNQKEEKVVSLYECWEVCGLGGGASVIMFPTEVKTCNYNILCMT